MENKEEFIMDETSNNTITGAEVNMAQPTPAFVGVSWVALIIGTIAYCVGLYNAEMQLNEKGYYLAIFLFGLFATITVQKNVRDKLEGIKISDLYYNISWVGVLISVIMLVVGLWNAQLLLSEKGFFAMAFFLSLYASIVVQKNVRDKQMV